MTLQARVGHAVLARARLCGAVDLENLGAHQRCPVWCNTGVPSACRGSVGKTACEVPDDFAIVDCDLALAVSTASKVRNGPVWADGHRLVWRRATPAPAQRHRLHHRKTVDAIGDLAFGGLARSQAHQHHHNQDSHPRNSTLTAAAQRQKRQS